MAITRNPVLRLFVVGLSLVLLSRFAFSQDQTPALPAVVTQPPASQNSSAASGVGAVRGIVKAGNVPIPGAAVSIALDSSSPITAYFRMDPKKYYVEASLVVPGSEIPFTRASDRDKTSLDVIGLVLDPEQHPLTHIRDTVKLAVDTSSEVRKKNVQYNTGLDLPPGKYHLKFVVRENQTGRMGSFETDLIVPDLKSQPLKMSSIVLASQTQTAKKASAGNPLIRDGEEIVPNVTHVFSSTQHLKLYYEIYDRGRGNAPPPSRTEPANSEIHLLTNVAFFRGKAKVYESSLIEVTVLNGRDRKAGVFQLDLPLSSLTPGFYTAQVNVIDDASGAFLFPRFALLIRSEITSRNR